MKKLIAAILMTAAFAGCSKNTVPQSTLEDARATGRANAEWNASAYRAENPRLQGMRIIGHADTAQTQECPQGSGWARLSMMTVEKDDVSNTKVEKIPVVCSTVSASLGCYREKDFMEGKLAKQEGNCDKSLPHPLVKIAK